MSEPRPAKSGCALALGFLLVGVGSLLLISNLVGFSLTWFWRQILSWFSVYWPVVLIVWGIYKVYQRVVHPESSRVGAGEILLLIFIICAGVTIHVSRRFVTGLPIHISLDDVIESIDSDLSFGPAHSFEEEHRFEIPADVGLLIENDRGSVSVQGWDEPELKVSVTKRVYRHSEDRASEIAKDIQVRFDAASEGPARFHMETPANGPKAVTDLEISIPRQTPLTVSNRRGPLRVSGLRAPVSLATSSDSIEVKDIHGSLRVNGRRGPVRIERIEGDVEARNRYGELSIRDVKGNLIGETRNDSLFVENVSGTARLMNRQSRVRATDVGGDLTIEATHSEVSIENAGATVFIETSYRPIFVKEVEGRLSIEARSSEIEIRDVKGNLDVSNIHRPVTAVGIAGGAAITARKGEVRLDEVGGPIQIESSYHPVNLRRFQSSVSVHTEHAPITVATEVLGGELSLVTSYADVLLTLPTDSSFRLEARVKGGEILSDFRQAGWKESTSEEIMELRGTAGGGAPSIVIETSYGDIKVLGSTTQ